MPALNCPSPPDRQPVDEQHHDGSENRHENAGAVGGPVHAHGAPGVASQDGAEDAEQDRDDEAAGILAGHQELGDHTHHKSEHYPSQNAKHANTSTASNARDV